MQVTETLSEGLKRGFTVTVPADALESKRSARLVELGKTMNMPGFRPGKVPLSIVRQRYGAAVEGEVLEQTVNDATREVLDGRALRPAGQPRVELVRGGDGKGDLEFSIALDLLPEITLPDFSELSLTRLTAEVDDATVERALTDIARRQRSFETIEEDRGAEKGEVLNVDFVGKIDGEAFEGGTANGVDVEVEGPGFIPGFTEQLAGLKKGDTRTINVSFPADYTATELAGKDATFDITVHDLKRPIDPALDDALAEKIGFENIGEIREAIAGQVRGEYEQISRMRIKRELLDQLAGKTDFEAPPGMVDAEFGAIWQRVEADRKAGQQDADDQGKDEETLKADYRKIAERRVKLGLLLAEAGRANNISVTQEELFGAMRAEAMRYPGQEQQVIEFFSKNPQAAESLRGPIFENKVVDYVIELAKVEDKTVTPEELAEMPPADL